MKPVKTNNPEIFRKIIQTDEYAIGALMKLYSYQTADERQIGGTVHDNGMGFNGTDSQFCSSLAKQYQDRGRLTEKQLASLKRLLPKYHRQIDVCEPMKIHLFSKKEKQGPQEKRATLNKNTISLCFPFDWNIISRVKLLSGRRWDASKKQWNVPISLETVDSLMSLGFKLDSKITDWYSQQTSEVTEGIGKIPGLKTELYPFQDVGVAFIESRDGRALIGDDMGLGKTVQALGWLQLRKKEVLPALIVSPASAKAHWVRKTHEFTDMKACSVSGRCKKSFDGHENCDIYCINYDVIHESTKCDKCQDGLINGRKCKTCKGKGKVAKLDSWIASMNFKTVVFDEIHYTKTTGTGRTAAAMEISKMAKNVIGLSGTPITNRPVEFFNAINMINNKIFPSWWKYTGKYCDRKNNGFGQDVSGASNTAELHEKLTQTIMLRRLKKDVLKQLPPKVRSVVPIPINQDKYDRIMQEAEQELKGQEAAHLSIIEKAKQAVVELKLKCCIDWIQDYIDNDEKLVVFAHHKETIETLTKHFKGQCVTVYGGTSQKDKDTAEERFQNDPEMRLFFGSMAAKEALTLTAAKATCFIELWWTPGDHDQAEDRVHRIGQEADSVMAYYLLAEGTIEEDIAELLDKKRKVLASVLDGKDVEDFNMLSKLMEKLTKKEEN